MKKPPAPTHTNLYTLRSVLAVSPDRVIRKVDAVDAPHLRRCIDAGFLARHATERGAWVLSDAGRLALSFEDIDMPKSMFVDGVRYEVFLRGTELTARCAAADARYLATFSTGKLAPVSADFPSALLARIEERCAP